MPALDRERLLAVYEGLILPYTLAFSLLTVGVGVGFVYPLIAEMATVNLGGLLIRWLGIATGMFVAGFFVWWLVVDAREHLAAGAFLIAVATIAETVGGGYLLLRSPAATSFLALLAAALTALSLVLVVASLAVITMLRERYGQGLLFAHWIAALAVPLSLIVADRALRFEPDPVIGLVFVIVPFVALLMIANAILAHRWRSHSTASGGLRGGRSK